MLNKMAREPRKLKVRPQVTRKRADRLLREIVKEAINLNSDDRLWYEVTKISVFGSYLSDKQVLGDLDIAVRLSPRWILDDSRFNESWLEFELVCPPPEFVKRDFLSLIDWPRTYLFYRLRKVGRGISVHSHSELDSCGFEHRVLFERSEAEVRLRP